MYAIPTLVVLVLLKRYFSGGVFNIPKVDLSDKYAVVTGGNSGIGAETVKELAKLGCSIIIGARSRETAEEVIKSIKNQNNKAKVEYISLDLSSKESIESFAKSVQFPKIDYMVNNAGIMSIPKRKVTKDGF
jgi:short-subunit dehydrogenase